MASVDLRTWDVVASYSPGDRVLGSDSAIWTLQANALNNNLGIGITAVQRDALTGMVYGDYVTIAAGNAWYYDGSAWISFGSPTVGTVPPKGDIDPVNDTGAWKNNTETRVWKSHGAADGTVNRLDLVLKPEVITLPDSGGSIAPYDGQWFNFLPEGGVNWFDLQTAGLRFQTEGAGTTTISTAFVSSGANELFARYNAATNAWILYHQAGNDLQAGSEMTKAVYQFTKANGQSGGTPSATNNWARTELNNEKFSSIVGASLSGEQITLPAGFYEDCELAQVFYQSNYTNIRLHDVTNDVTLIDNAFPEYSSNATNVTVKMEAKGDFTLLAPAVCEMQYFISAAESGTGLGVAVNGDGLPEVFAQVRLNRK